MGRTKKITVFYDGSCPLCAREIDFYKRRKGAETVNWFDVSRCESDKICSDLTKEHALARLHVRKADGQLVAGGKAFAHLWAALPQFRFMGCVFLTRPFVWCLDGAYDIFLRIRPRLQAMVRPPA